MKNKTTYAILCSDKDGKTYFSIKDDGTVQYTVDGELKTCTDNKELAQAFAVFIINQAMPYLE